MLGRALADAVSVGICARSTAILIALAPASFALAESAPEQTKLVVYTLRAPQHLAPLARRLTDSILVDLGKRADLAVLGEAEVELILSHLRDEADLSQPDCQRVEDCLAKLTSAADAEKMISGSLGELGGSFVVTISLTDARRAIVERSETCSADNETELDTCLLKIVELTLGGAGQRASSFAISASSKAKVAVAPISGLDERAGVAASLTQLFGLELRKAELQVITADEIVAMIDHLVQREQCKGSGGDLTSCLIEVGGAMGVDYVAMGAIGRFDDSYIVVLKLIDIRRAEVVQRVSESYRGPEAQLPKLIRFATAALLGRKLEGHGDLAIITDVSAELELDRDPPRKLPLPDPIRDLANGKHALTLRADGYFAYHAEVFIEAGADNRFEPELIELPTPWYASWWFWTIAGVVAAGATTTALVLTGSNNEIDADGVVSLRDRP